MLYTIGHSNISADDFVSALDTANAHTVIDIRSHPTSRYEQFRLENMQKQLGLRYEWWPSLGGWTDKHIGHANKLLEYDVDVAAYSGGKFPKHRIGSRRKEEKGWESTGLHDYQFFMMLDEFNQALDTLISRAAFENLTIMCAEALWWKCHRSMVADAVLWRGGEVYHIMYRFRKTLLPRCITTTTNHADHYSERIGAYHGDVLEAWKLWNDN